MWKTTNALGKEHIWYSKEEVQEIIAKIKTIAETHIDILCMEPNWKCESCPDETTNYGKTCMQNGMNKIKEIIDGVQND